ncbi:MAG TPA: 6-pyruvoyl-tetrahydropterin synthase-related protein [Pyrinomonadaceae bacterium]|jgi:hypothetical protein|nr:6-pyruvoyl-tetrahydropterin synthase-related protein [Pyrinomonadaceae bacterium]
MNAKPASALKLKTPLGEWRAIIVVAAVGVVVLIPIIIWGIPVGNDLGNHYRFAIAFHDSLLSGKLYPGWLAPSNFGYGDARVRFYPPGLYFLFSVVRLLMGWYPATIVTFCLLSIVGGLGVYFWTRSLGPSRTAMWAGIAYAIAPYHINQLYRASMLAEYAGCSVLPFAFAFVERICRKGKAADIAGLAVSFALLILLNLPLTLIGSLSLAVYALLRIRREVFWPTLMKLALASLTALAATAFFWSTVVTELHWIKGNTVDPNIYYDYRVNFLFSPANLINYGAWYTNLLGVVTIAFLLPALVFFKRTLFAKERDRALKAIFLMTLISLLMATELSRPIWFIVPKLREVQFPWRWLGVTSMFGSILLAASIPQWIEKLRTSFRPRDLAVGFALALSLLFVAYAVVWDAEYLKGQEFIAKFPTSRGAPSFKDWRPLWAKDIPEMKKMNADVEADSRLVTIKSWDPEHRTFHISGGPSAEARVRTYYYPLWAATAQGVTLSVHPADDGALLITIPPGDTDVELTFQEPRRVATARIVSTIGWILIAGLFAFGLTIRLKSSYGPKRSAALAR